MKKSQPFISNGTPVICDGPQVEGSVRGTIVARKVSQGTVTDVSYKVDLGDGFAWFPDFDVRRESEHQTPYQSGASRS